MSTENVPLLTAEMAALLRGHDPAHIAGCAEALEAIATERAVVVPRMTEAEAMAMCAHNAGSADDYAINLDGYIAALRDLGVLRD